MNRCLTLASLLAATLAFATPPAPEDPATLATRATVDKELIKPLAAKELSRSRYSRSRQPAQARRVRVLDTLKDSNGKEFRTFAVDARHGRDLLEDDELAVDAWRKDTITGCVYADSGEVFISRKASYFPAAFLLGKKAKAAAEHTCRSQPTEVASAK